MRLWLIRVTAIEAYLGNPDDPIHWHFKMHAKTAAAAIAATRGAAGISDSMKIEAFPEGQW